MSVVCSDFLTELSYTFITELLLSGEEMRLTNSMIYDVVGEAVGEEAIPIVEYLKDRKNVSDFKIAEKTNIKIQRVRSLLYKLNEHNLVTYRRKKDNIKGWYISYFNFNKKGIKELVDKLRKQKYERYSQRLAVEQNGGLFYMCPNMCARLDFDNAHEFEFKCPECGGLMEQQDNQKTIKHLREKLNELKVAN